jgi:hypothetical protein
MSGVVEIGRARFVNGLNIPLLAGKEREFAAQRSSSLINILSREAGDANRPSELAGLRYGFATSSGNLLPSRSQPPPGALPNKAEIYSQKVDYFLLENHFHNEFYRRAGGISGINCMGFFEIIGVSILIIFS